VAFARCYLYSLTSGTNGFDVTSKDFLDAAFRFGVDNPFPTIQKRINFYGNDADLELLLEEINSNENALLQF
jgi:hypothetical protein